MLYFSDVSDVLLQSIFKLNDDEKLSTSITISESQLVIMVKFNPMISKLNSTITANGGAHTLTHD